MNKKVVLGIASLLILVLLGVGIFKQVTTHQETEIIKIGAILPLTGKASFIGQSIANGLKIAEIENSKKVKLYIEDCQGDPKLALSAYKKLLSTEDIKYYIPALSSVTNALLTDAERNNSLLFSTCVSSAKITLKSKNLYRLFLNSDGDARVMADFAIDSLHKMKFAVIFVNDDFGKDYYNTFKDQVEKKGGKIVFIENFERGSVDYKDVIIKLKVVQKNVDGLYLLGYDNNFGIFLKQFGENKLTIPIFSIATISQPTVVEAIKENLGSLPKIFYTNTLLYSKVSTNNQIKEKFIANYMARFGEKPDYFAAFAYDWINVIANCNPKNISKDILNKEFLGVMGKIKFDSVRDAKFPVVIESLN